MKQAIMIQISINNNKQTLNKGATVSQAIQTLGFENETMLGVALNKTFVPKEKWQETQLNDNDQLDILRPVSGG